MEAKDVMKVNVNGMEMYGVAINPVTLLLENGKLFGKKDEGYIICSIDYSGNMVQATSGYPALEYNVEPAKSIPSAIKKRLLEAYDDFAFAKSVSYDIRDLQEANKEPIDKLKALPIDIRKLRGEREVKNKER